MMSHHYLVTSSFGSSSYTLFFFTDMGKGKETSYKPCGEMYILAAVKRLCLGIYKECGVNVLPEWKIAAGAGVTGTCHR